MSMDFSGSAYGYSGGARDSGTSMAPAEGSTGFQTSRGRTSTLLPLLATGLSAWWLISTLRGTPPVPRKVRRAASNLGHRATSMAAPMGQKTGRVASKVKERAGSITSQVRERAGSVASQVRDRAGTVAQGLHQKTSHVKGSVSSTTGHARSELERLIQDEPLMVCGAAALLGAAVGALIPETPPEHRMMGPARDTLLQKGREAVSHAAERVRSHSKPGGPTDALLQAMGLVQGARMRHEEHEPTADEILHEGHVDVGASTEFEPDEPLPTRDIHDEAMPSPAEEGHPLFRHTEPREDLMRREIGEDPHF